MMQRRRCHSHGQGLLLVSCRVPHSLKPREERQQGDRQQPEIEPSQVARFKRLKSYQVLGQARTCQCWLRHDPLVAEARLV